MGGVLWLLHEIDNYLILHGFSQAVLNLSAFWIICPRSNVILFMVHWVYYTLSIARVSPVVWVYEPWLLVWVYEPWLWQDHNVKYHLISGCRTLSFFFCKDTIWLWQDCCIQPPNLLQWILHLPDPTWEWFMQACWLWAFVCKNEGLHWKFTQIKFCVESLLFRFIPRV